MQSQTQAVHRQEASCSRDLEGGRRREGGTWLVWSNRVLKWTRLAGLALALVMLLVSCRAATPTPTTEGPGPLFPLTLTDSNGRQVTFQKPPQRIVSFSPAHTETLFAIGAGSLVVGTDRFSDYPAEANKLPKVGDAFSLDQEKLAALKPDLVYLDFSSYIPQVERLGVPVLYLKPPTDLEGVFEQVLLLGKLTGHLPEARTLAQHMRERVELIMRQVAPINQGPRVFYELDPTLYTAGPDSFIGDLLKRLRANNIAKGATTPYPQLSPEAVVQADPQVILLADSSQFGSGAETPESVKARPGWGSISAVRQGRVYSINPDLTSRPGPRIVDGLEALARALYPDKFP
ncbi:MAG: ABC transporter substrate-binding protein [Chloroflexi bacterium]|nr:ABC transporter substrate-binding protein [Chloroflexota bacterium]